ncbi:hypothetical protein ACHAW5_004301 [Stephanodiscus triporus]|uniref:Uncharacterized protein n=1 Tax=Stephanodiscus triporus TaxID=2934178 RepID=A0ABD3QJ08_9STRA
MNNSSLPSSHPDFAGAMGGRALPPPPARPGMFGHLSRDSASYTSAASTASPYGGYADAILGGRYAAAAAAAVAEPLPPSLSQDLRRQDAMALGVFGDGVGQHHQHQASLLLEEKLLRLHHITEAELAARAFRDQVAAQEQQRQAQQQAAQQQQQAAQDERFIADSIDRIVALQEHQALQRLAAGGAAGGLGGSLGWLASQAQGGYSHAQQLQLAEEAAAIRERFAHGRAIEEDAARRHRAQQHRHQFQHQDHHSTIVGHGRGGLGGPGPGPGPGPGRNVTAIHSLAPSALNAGNDALARLLQLQQLSDEDLIQRAAEVQQNVVLREGLDPRSGAAGRVAAESLLERQFLEAHLLRGGVVGGGLGGLSRFQPGGAERAGPVAAVTARSIWGGDDGHRQQMSLDPIHQAYIDASLARRGLGNPPSHNVGNNFRPGLGHPAVAAGGSHPQQPSNLIPQQPYQQPLRYFMNGTEVDMDGNPFPIANEGNDSNVISRFISAVTQRVPEIGPALAVLLPQGKDPTLIGHEFMNVVDAAAALLRSIQERCARSNDDVTFDLHRRITGCIALIESNSVDLGLEGAPPRAVSALAPPPPMAHAGIVPPLSAMRPGAYQSLLGGGAAAGGMVLYPIHEEQLAMAHRHHQHHQASVISYQSVIPPEGNVALASLKGNNNVSQHGVTNSESPVDDNMPMMAMYKSNKKAAKRAMKAEKRKRKPKLVHKVNALLKTVDPPSKKLVHHTLFKGGFDPNKVAESSRLPESEIPDCSTPSDPTKEAPQEKPASPKTSGGSSTKSDDAKESAEAYDNDERSQPTKKRRAVDQSNDDDDNDNDYNSIPVDNIYQKNGKVKNDNKHGPHGDVIEKLFDCVVKPSTDNIDENEAKSKLSADDACNGGPPLSEGAIDKSVEPSPQEVVSKSVEDAAGDHDANDARPHGPRTESESSVITEDSEKRATTDVDVHLGAASVLLDLMGK